MLSFARRFDGWIAASRPAWLWLGQLGIVALGAHLAADRVDDVLAGLIDADAIPYVSDADVLLGAALVALALEIGVVARAAWVLVASAGAPAFDREAWWRKRSVESFVRPLFWGVMALAGAWSILIAVEGLFPGLGPAATAIGAVVAGLAAWRLGLSGWTKVTAGLFQPRSVRDGLPWAPALLAATVLGLMQLPVWGWT